VLRRFAKLFQSALKVLCRFEKLFQSALKVCLGLGQAVSECSESMFGVVASGFRVL